MTVDITTDLSAKPSSLRQSETIDFEFTVFSQRPLDIEVEYRLDETNSVWFEAEGCRSKSLKKAQMLGAGAAIVRHRLRLERLPAAGIPLFGVFVTAEVTEAESHVLIGRTPCLIRLEE